jgi:hypothetical protein
MRIAGAAPRPTPAGDPAARGTPSWLAPVPPAPRFAPPQPDPDLTLLGPAVAPRTQAPRPPNGTPQVGGQLPVKSLRDAYPMIHRAPASPTRPHATQFDDRPASSVNFGAAFDMSGTVRRDAVVRRVALAVGIAIALLALIAIVVVLRRG